MIARLVNRLRDETGLGMPIAMSVLTVVMLLAAWSVSSSQSVHTSADRDGSVKRALGPADAAVQRAAWRLDQTTPSPVGPNDCIISQASGVELIQPADAAGNCPTPAQPVSMGNGNSYSFSVGPAITQAQINAGARCGGRVPTVGDRCTISAGASNGVSRRVQALVNRPVVNQSVSPWGLVGRTSVGIENNVHAYTCDGDIAGTIGSNGTITFGNNGDRLDDQYCDGTDDGSWGITHLAPPTGQVIGNPDPGPGGPPPRTEITEPFPFPEIAWPTTGVTVPSTPMYNPVTKVLNVTSNLVLAGGVYHLCGLVLDGGNLNVNLGAPVTIYVNSPDNDPAFCTSGTGDGLWLKGNEQLNWGGNADMGSDDLAARARLLKIFVARNEHWEANRRPCQGNASSTILICNNNKVAGSIYAPLSTMYFRNSGQLVGAITVDRLVLENGLLHRLPDGMGDMVASTSQGAPEVAGWTECVSTGTGNAGCT